jgi:ornithine--oxo-acid transaminase
VLGKALGGGILPLSAVVGRDDVIGVLRPGEHGSTFGGNPLASAVGREVLSLLANGRLIQESAALGDGAAARLRAAAHPAVREVRQRGLWLGIELVDAALPARRASERLMERGVLARDTHETTLRIAPPLTVTAEELDWALERLDEVLEGLL